MYDVIVESTSADISWTADCCFLWTSSTAVLLRLAFNVIVVITVLY